jgi:hypothetical protein
MKKLSFNSRKLLLVVSNLERKHKVITYASLLFLTISTYFLRTENQKVKIDFATLQERNLNLKQNMIIFNRSYEEFPLPVWQKVKRGDKFIMQYTNPSFVKEFGHLFNNNQYNVIGKNDFEVWPEKFAQTFYENDIAVSIMGKVLNTDEEFIDKSGKPIYAKVLKWRSIRDNRDTLVYGMVQRISKIKE